MQKKSLQAEIIATTISLLEKDGFHTFDLHKVSKEMKVNVNDIKKIYSDTNVLIQAALKQTLMVSFVENLEECVENYYNNHGFLKQLFQVTLVGALQYPKMIKSHFYTSFISGKEQKQLTVFIEKTWEVIKPQIKTDEQELSRRRLNQAFASLLFVALLPQVFPLIDCETWSRDLAQFVIAN